MAENEQDARSAQAQVGAEQTRGGEQGTEKVRAEQQSGERTHDRPVFRPSVDICETNDGMVLEADIPGVTADGLNITLEKRVLSIYGRVSATAPEGFSPVHREYQIGDFERQFTLSGDFNTDAIQADLSDGVLRIIIPRAPEHEAKRIDVRGAP